MSLVDAVELDFAVATAAAGLAVIVAPAAAELADVVASASCGQSWLLMTLLLLLHLRLRS